MEKKWYFSKIFWVNTITFLVAVIPMLHEYLATVGVSAGFLLSAVAGLNVVLRLFGTSTKLTS